MAANNQNTDTGKTDSSSGSKVDATMESYKKNLEIFWLINKMSMEGFNGITKLQVAFLQQMISDMSGVWGGNSKPSEKLMKFSEVAQNNIVKAMNNGKQISDIITTTNSEIRSALTKMVKESMGGK